MSVQSDVELLYIMARENYAKEHSLSSKEVQNTFHENHILENIMLQHEYLHQISLQEVFEFVDKIIADKDKTLFVYHGTTYDFKKIDLNKSHNRRDFGQGFYTTILEDQARQWAYRLALRNHMRKYYVYKYCFIDDADLRIKRFDGLTVEWLEFIKKNRFDGGTQHNYDVVIGPVADDNTMMTVQLYVMGVIDAEESIKRLRYAKVNNQMSLHTEKALSFLQFVGKDEYHGTNLHV